MSNKEFDKFIKNKAQQRQFDFDEANWLDMQQLLPPTPPAATPWAMVKSWMSGWQMWAVIGAVAVTSIVVVLSNATHTSTSNETILSENIKKSTITSTPSDKPKQVEEAMIKGIDNENNINNRVVLDVNDGEKNKEEVSNNSGADPRKNLNKPTQITPTTILDIDKKEPNTPTSLFDNNIDFKTIKNTTKSEQNSTISNNPIIEEVENTEADKKTFLNKIPDANTPETPENNLIEQPIATIESTPKQQQNLLSIDFLNKKNFEVVGTKPAIKQDKEWIEPIKPRKSYAVSIVGGMTISQGLTNQEINTVANSYDPQIGLQGKLGLNDKWSVQLGILASRRGQLNSTLQQETTVYSFGYRRSTTEVAIKHLYQAQVPLMLSYRLTYESSLQFGLNYAYLLNTYSEVAQLHEDSFTASAESSISNSWGYVSGFKQHDMGIVGGYIHHIKERTQLGIFAKYGLMDITDNTQFNNTVTDKNMQFYIFMSYDLINRN